VKLVRVLMLGPVCLALSFAAPHLATGSRKVPTGERPGLTRLVPWFILGFLSLVACRSLGLIPAPALAPISQAATFLTIVSMAALGLGVDVRTVAKAGGRVTAAVILSLVGLGAISLVLIRLLHLA
jgi:uncharacterized membrane protein YadS